MALVAGRVHDGGGLPVDVWRPVSVEGLLHRIHIELSRELAADLAYDLEVVQAVRAQVYAAEELPVQVAVEALDQLPVRAVGVVLQEHQGDLAPGGEDRPRAFFRLLEAQGRYHIVPGDRPVNLAKLGSEETVVKGVELFLLGGERESMLEIADSSYLVHRVFDIKPRFSS